MAEFYGADLSYIHDDGHTAYVRNAAPFLLETLRRSNITEGTVVDLGCGSGRWTKDLSVAGYQAVGIDVSREMLKLARKQAPKAKYVAGSMWSTPFPSCVAVTSIGECLNYRSTARERKKLRPLFQRVFRALEPGGLFIFDLHTLRGSRKKIVQQKHRVAEGWAVLVDLEKDPQRRLLTRQITFFRRHGANYRRQEETHYLELYERQEIAEALRSVGFRIRSLRSYGDQPLFPNLAAFLARKLPSA